MSGRYDILGYNLALAGVIGLLGLLACNAPSLIGNPRPNASPTPIASAPTPPPTPVPTLPPCDPNVVGPAPNLSAAAPMTAGQVNADYYFRAPDTWDQDDNTYKFVWGCTADPLDPNPPHKVVETWDMSMDDGDPNAFIDGPIAGGGVQHFFPCCYVVP